MKLTLLTCIRQEVSHRQGASAPNPFLLKLCLLWRRINLRSPSSLWYLHFFQDSLGVLCVTQPSVYLSWQLLQSDNTNTKITQKWKRERETFSHFLELKSKPKSCSFAIPLLKETFILVMVWHVKYYITIISNL